MPGITNSYEDVYLYIGVKALYYFHTSNRKVWIFAGRPRLPSQILLEQQIL